MVVAWLVIHVRKSPLASGEFNHSDNEPSDSNREEQCGKIHPPISEARAAVEGNAQQRVVLAGKLELRAYHFNATSMGQVELAQTALS